MPQGDKHKSKADGVVPKHETYARKEIKRHGPPIAMMTDAFASALPRMVQNAEAIAAAKLLRSGALVRLKDVKAVGQQELKQKAIETRKKNPISALLGKQKNIKGIRGAVDAEELAALQPELKALLDHRKATSGGGRKRPAEDTEDSGAGAGSSSSASASFPALAGPFGGGSKRPKPSGLGGPSKGAGAAKKAKTDGGAGGEGPGGEALFASDDAVAATFGKDFV